MRTCINVVPFVVQLESLFVRMWLRTSLVSVWGVKRAHVKLFELVFNADTSLIEALKVCIRVNARA